MPYDVSADTLVCELRFPVALGVLAAAAVLAAVAAVTALPLAAGPTVVLGILVAAYGLASLWRWWRSMPARLVITGDGRCRGLGEGGEVCRYGSIRDGVVWRFFVVIKAVGRRRRYLLITRGMVREAEFRRLRARLRTVTAP